MRTVALSLVLALTTAVAMAFHPSSSVHVVLMGHHPAMTVIFNGQAYRPGMQQLTFSGLAPGIYPLRVMRPGHPARATVYAGSVHVPALSNVQVNVMPHGGVQVHSTPIAVVHPVPAPVHGPGWCGTLVQVGMAPEHLRCPDEHLGCAGF